MLAKNNWLLGQEDDYCGLLTGSISRWFDTSALCLTCHRACAAPRKRESSSEGSREINAGNSKLPTLVQFFSESNREFTHAPVHKELTLRSIA